MFRIFWEGTQQCTAVKSAQSKRAAVSDLRKEWPSVKDAFNSALLDVAEISSEKTSIEQWFDVVKKVMAMWESDDHSGATKTPTDSNEADDYYVFMYDEDKKSKYKTKFDSDRVLGFWCFNAGIGFRKIKALKPRSILLTSGTLSPLSSFEAEL